IRALIVTGVQTCALPIFADPRVVLEQLLTWVRPGGRVVIVEYDGRRPSRWVPYPISAERLPEIVAGLGLSRPTITATRPSAYGRSEERRVGKACVSRWVT